MKATEFLNDAAITMEQRGKTYDSSSGERSMAKTITAFNSITGKELSPSEGWLMMLLLKQVRQFSKPDYHEDSALDAVAYAALLAEELSEE